MSLVLGYATKDIALIMSDGRAGIDGSYSEHYNKTLKINDNIILGFVGIVEGAEPFLQHTIEQMGTARNNYLIDDFLEMIEFFMDDSDTQKYFNSTLMIIGRDNKNNMHVALVGNATSYKIERNLVDTTRVLSIGGCIEGNIITDIFFESS